LANTRFHGSRRVFFYNKTYQQTTTSKREKSEIIKAIIGKIDELGRRSLENISSIFALVK